jgi:hypothetical protein
MIHGRPKILFGVNLNHGSPLCLPGTPFLLRPFSLSEIWTLQPSRKRGGVNVALNQGDGLLPEENFFSEILLGREHGKDD